MPTLREQNKSLMNDFVTSSPMVFLTCPTKLLFKPITLTMPVPEGHSTNTLTVSPAMMDRMTGDRRADRSIVMGRLQVQ
ncbi:hypothetical protein FGIG_12209 [Fasciola gigantica]|uniref:Uncharacterized protein n=1 Tax=Fasciola gigantica TaxID=46835 RepID=A0A504Z0F9_FASGI|nr:hypothetical protein FGIG_12209 [Fasciola gigantica]